MEFNKAKQLAQSLLDSEFNEVNNNPVGYCEAMGWKKNSKSTRLAMAQQGMLEPNFGDIDNLTKIINSIDSEDAAECMESNTVCDFLCNCVAGHIIS